MNTPHTTARRHAGFTLIECCVAMSVAGVLATTAVPSMQSMLDGQKLRNASADLVSDLRLARDAALTRGENVRITVKTAAGASCTIVHTGAAADCVCGADPAVPPSCSGDATLIRATRLPAASAHRADDQVAVGRVQCAARHGLPYRDLYGDCDRRP